MSKSIVNVGLVESCICVNMVVGPMGHAGGMSMSDIGNDIISLFVTVTIPRNHFLANVVVLIQLPDYSLASTKPFYISVKEKGNLAVDSSPQKIIPHRGFVSPGTKVLMEFQECEESAIHLQLLHTFTAMIYYGPLNYQKVSNQKPRLNNKQSGL